MKMSNLSLSKFQAGASPHAVKAGKGRLRAEGIALFLLLFLQAILVPTTGQGSTMDDVLKFMAENPAPVGCYNWPEKIPQSPCGNTGTAENPYTTVIVYRKCDASKTKAYDLVIATSSYMWTFYSAYKCDGTNDILSLPGNALFPVYVLDYTEVHRYYCDGHDELYSVTANNYPVENHYFGTKTPCQRTPKYDVYALPVCKNLDVEIGRFKVCQTEYCCGVCGPCCPVD